MLLLQINLKDMEKEDDKNNESKVCFKKKSIAINISNVLSNTEVIILHYQILLGILET